MSLLSGSWVKVTYRKATNIKKSDRVEINIRL